MGVDICESVINSSDYQQLEDERWAIHHIKGIGHRGLNHFVAAMSQFMIGSEFRNTEINQDTINEMAEWIMKIDPAELQTQSTEAKEYCLGLFDAKNDWNHLDIKRVVFPIKSFLNSNSFEWNGSVLAKINILTSLLEKAKKKEKS